MRIYFVQRNCCGVGRLQHCERILHFTVWVRSKIVNRHTILVPARCIQIDVSKVMIVVLHVFEWFDTWCNFAIDVTAVSHGQNRVIRHHPIIADFSAFDVATMQSSASIFGERIGHNHCNSTHIFWKMPLARLAIATSALIIQVTRWVYLKLGAQLMQLWMQERVWYFGAHI